MSSTADRINKKMQELDLSQADVIRATGAGRATVSGWFNGANAPSAKYLDSLAKVLKTSTRWILTGATEPNHTIQTIETWDSNTPLEEDEVEIPFFKDFSFACGSGNIGEALESETRKLRMSKTTLRNKAIEKQNAVATTASGDSMSPTIKDGDTIHIDLGRKNIKDGKIFAICHGGLFLAKRLYNLPLGGIRVVSDNSIEFPEITLTAEEVVEQQFEIIGWIWQISSMENW